MKEVHEKPTNPSMSLRRNQLLQLQICERHEGSTERGSYSTHTSVDALLHRMFALPVISWMAAPPLYPRMPGLKSCQIHRLALHKPLGHSHNISDQAVN